MARRGSVWRVGVFAVAFGVAATAGARAQDAAADPNAPLYQALDEVLALFRGQAGETWTFRLDGSFGRGDATEAIKLAIVREGEETFGLDAEHPKLALRVRRDENGCTLWSSRSDTLYRGRGAKPDGDDRLVLGGLYDRLLEAVPDVGDYLPVITMAPAQLMFMMGRLSAARVDGDGEIEYALYLRGGQPVGRAVVTAGAKPSLKRLEIKYRDVEVKTDISLARTAAWKDVAAAKTVDVDRAELEKALARGLGRVLEIQYENHLMPRPRDRFVRGEHGYYRVRAGQRLVGLAGTPRERGLQHGRFLPKEIRKTVDSTLYVVGTVYSLEKGSWFLDDIRKAQARCGKFMPAAHIEEIRGLAEGSGVSFDELYCASYFPELFHCSGFAFFGEATTDGTLYHGRILDYIVDAGLQYQAAVFAVRPDDGIPYVDVGFAGFIGSVTGMNAAGVALGEMGGRGEGDWDGVPMSSLMKLALETAENLDDAKAVFVDNPRTCEYYYVFSDAKDNRAAACYATPEEIWFLEPNEAHERLPHPFPDAVLMSAGKRYEQLVAWVREAHGKIDAETACRLTDYPVAGARSNLHTAVMVPATGDLYVRNADKSGPAYKQPFYKYNLEELLADLPTPEAAPAEAEVPAA